MKRLALLLTSVLAVSAFACKDSTTSKPPGSDPANPADPSKPASDNPDAPASDNPDAPKTDGEPPGPDAQKECAAETGDPKTLFGDMVLVRLPKGVDIVEQTPSFARITSSTTVSTCDAVVSYAGVSWFAADPAKPVEKLRQEIMEARGFGDTPVTWSEETTKGRDFSGAFEVPEGPKGEPPIKGWLVIKEKYGKTFVGQFESHPNAWNAIKATFIESGKKLLITKNAQ